MSERIYITKSDRNKLSELLERSLGGARESKRTLEDLQKELARAQIVDAANVPPDVVTMNSLVSLKDLQTEEILVYRLVFPDAADIAEQRISILAPVGTAIIGCRTGDVIEWPVPSGIRKLKIEKVIYQPEAAGDYHL